MRASKWLSRAVGTATDSALRKRNQILVTVETEIYSPVINGDIHYRGYPLKQLAQRSTLTNTAHLLIKKELPDESKHREFMDAIKDGMKSVTPLIYKAQELMPLDANVADVMTMSLSLLNGDSGHVDDWRYEKVFGQCLAIMLHWHSVTRTSMQKEDPFTDFSQQFVLSEYTQYSDDNRRRLLDSIAILYTDHGLTSSSYAARICASEKSTIYSALLTAFATHRECAPMFTWEHFDSLFNACESEKMAVIHKFHEEKRMPKPFSDYVHPCKDPRTDILMECCGNDAIKQLLDIEEMLEGKCYLRFDVFVYHLIRSLWEYNQETAVAGMRSLVLMSRLIGWLAHIAEQRNVKRRLQHIAAYVGPQPRSL